MSVKRAIFGVVLVACGALACSSTPPPHVDAPDPDARTACVGGLCVKPDHVVAYKTNDGPRARCLVVAWDGASLLPPTAKVASVDDSPAHPGVFAAIDMPSLQVGLSYPIARDVATGLPGSVAVFSARVDPAVRFADQRVVDDGEVKLAHEDGGVRVSVTSKWGGGVVENASFLLPNAFNGCH